jgi:adenylate cyclase class 2
MDDTTVEREVKLAVSDLGPITARLHALEADDTSFLQTVHEHNSILDTPRGDLKARDERLRLRRIIGRPGVIVTWKGPGQVRHGVRRRPEREVHAADAGACAAIFAALGFHPVCSYEKVRSLWQLGNLIVCLDQLPFGDFVEIEFTDAVSVDDEPVVLQQTIALLGLENAPRVQASYARLQQEWDSREKRR